MKEKNTKGLESDRSGGSIFDWVVRAEPCGEMLSEQSWNEDRCEFSCVWRKSISGSWNSQCEVLRQECARAGGAAAQWTRGVAHDVTGDLWAGLESHWASSALGIILFLVRWGPFEWKHDLIYIFKGRPGCCEEKRWGRLWRRQEEDPPGSSRPWLLLIPRQGCWEM